MLYRSDRPFAEPQLVPEDEDSIFSAARLCGQSEDYPMIDCEFIGQPDQNGRVQSWTLHLHRNGSIIVNRDLLLFLEEFYCGQKKQGSYQRKIR